METREIRFWILIFSLLFLVSCHEKEYHPNGMLKATVFRMPFSNVETVSNYDTLGRITGKVDRINGMPFGKLLEYYPNGAIYSEANFEKGQLNGPQKIWYTNGALRTLANYKDGFVHGWRYTYDSVGQFVAIVAYYEEDFQYYVQGFSHNKQPTSPPEFYLNVKYDKESYSVGDTIKCVVKFPLDTLTRFSPQFWYLWGQVKPGTVITQKIANDYAVSEYPIQKDSSQIKFLAGEAATLIDYYAVVYLKNGVQFVCPVNESVTFSVPISD